MTNDDHRQKREIDYQAGLNGSCTGTFANLQGQRQRAYESPPPPPHPPPPPPPLMPLILPSYPPWPNRQPTYQKSDFRREHGTSNKRSPSSKSGVILFCCFVAACFIVDSRSEHSAGEKLVAAPVAASSHKEARDSSANRNAAERVPHKADVFGKVNIQESILAPGESLTLVMDRSAGANATSVAQWDGKIISPTNPAFEPLSLKQQSINIGGFMVIALPELPEGKYRLRSRWSFQDNSINTQAIEFSVMNPHKVAVQSRSQENASEQFH